MFSANGDRRIAFYEFFKVWIFALFEKEMAFRLTFVYDFWLDPISAF